MAEAVRIDGLRELQRAFARAENDIGKDLRDGLRSAAEPVRHDAEQLAIQRIRRVGPNWSRMRTGITRTLVYVAPRERGVKAKVRAGMKRPKFGTLLLERAMEPALEHNIGKAEKEAQDVLDDLFRRWSSL